MHDLYTKLYNESGSKTKKHFRAFTILSAVVLGVLVPMRIDGPYALEVGRKRTLSEQLLVYCSPNEKVPLKGGGGE